MHQLVVDFEAFYDLDAGYSLRTMTTTEYVLDSRFEAICLSYRIDGGPKQYFTGTKAEVQHLIDTEFPPAADTEVIGHNLLFDGAILEWHFGYVPAKYFCTMMGSRPFVAPFTNRMSLDKCCEFFNLGTKGKEVHRMNGLSRLDIEAQGLMPSYLTYCGGDVDLTLALHGEIARLLPEDEHTLLDLTIKKFTRPKLLLDVDVLTQRLDEVETNKAKMLLLLPHGVNAKTLGSNPQFMHVLGELIGHDKVPKKISIKTGKVAPAFSKKDVEFMALRDHPNPKVQTLIEARLLFKSTQEESRLQRFLDIAKLTPVLPVPLLYYGAHTGRLSGLDSINLQNLNRGGALRKALIAPEGYKVVTADLSAIEARIVAALSDCWALLTQFRAMDAGTGFGPYEAFASDVYGVGAPTVKEFKTQYPTERFVGKTCIAEGTPVLCVRGWIPIEQITPADRVWDGEDWVCQSGVVDNGWKETLSLCNTLLTPDHLVWSGTQWVEAQSVVHDADILSRALAHAADSLPSRDIYWVRTSGELLTCKTRSRVYDLLSVGPRNRFTILTDRGPLIVHNCILGLGYGMGAPKLKDQLELGDVDMTVAAVKGLVDLYRQRYREIPQLWKRLSHLLSQLANKNTVTWKMISAGNNSITLPNMMKLHYPGLALDDRGDATFNGFIGDSATPARIRIWGGYVLENITQALARIILTRAELRLAAAGLFTVLQVHDELVFVVQDAYVDRVKLAVNKVLVDPVPWLTNLPIACEIGVGQSYGDAK